jgi:hypothetical protein
MEMVSSFLDILYRTLTSDSPRCFWINLPTGGIAAAILFFSLNLNPHQGRTFREHVAEFDFVGLALIISGVICLLIGFSSGETSCKRHRS